MKTKLLAIGIILIFVEMAINPIPGKTSNRDDTTPPMTTAIMDPEFHIGWYPLGVMVTLNATDNESGVNVTYYRIDIGGWITYTQPFMIEDVGVLVVQFYSVDVAGNGEIPKQVQIKIDNEPPVTHASLEPPAPNGYNGWYISDILVTLNATDEESGVWRTYCNGMIYTGPFNWSGGLLTFNSIDNVGNWETPCTSPPFKIDKWPPIIKLNYTWERMGLRKYTIFVTATAFDNLSGMSGVEIYLNGILQEIITGAGPDYTWAFLYVPELNFTIKAIAYDVAGNVAEAELINPHSSSAQNLGQWIHKFMLFRQILYLFVTQLKEGNR